MVFLNLEDDRIVLPSNTTKKNAYFSITDIVLLFSRFCGLFGMGKMKLTGPGPEKSFFRLIRSATFLLAGVIFFNIGFAQNPIVTENQLPGTPIAVWGVPDFRDPDINGYATEISVNRGQTVRFKINVPSGSPYTIKIYRIGYYGGAGANLKADLGTFTGIAQPAGIYNPATGLVDCANWAESAHWDIPVNAVSGFYIAKIEGVDGSNHIVFTVRDDLSNSDLYFQTADATWQAYNGYGGNNLYDGTTTFPAGHAVKVSYNRPFFVYNAAFLTNGRGSDWYMNDAYPMIRWLERNGYDVTYTTSVDIARAGNLITNHKVFVTAGHDEYWSKEQRDYVEAARNAGVHMAFFTGNDIYWKTRWEADAGGNSFHTLVCYKEGTMDDGSTNERACGFKCDISSPVWTGLWRMGSAYDAPVPENALSGQISWQESTSPIKVPFEYKDYRFWRNTTVANLAPGGEASLGINTLGYEWDFEQFPDTYPNGRMTMSSTTILGKTHKLSLYRYSSGALVFGAGTIQWSWGLDDQHYGGTGNVVSKDMQQATVNLFADMGIQPGTIQSDLVPATASTDNIAPVSVITSPANGSSLLLNGAITISGTSSEAHKLAGIEVSVDGGLTWKLATGTTNWSFVWLPAGPGTYTIKVRGYDDTGNMEAPGSSGPNVSVVTLTPDNIAPVSTITTPANGSTLQSNGVISITGTATDANAVQKVEISVNGGTSWITATGTTNWNYNWTPPGPGTYTIKSRATDFSGNVEVVGSSGPNVVTITLTPDLVAPVSVITSPANGATLPSIGIISITGTSADANGTTLVEISLDGGTTWNAATGTSTWSYSWTPTGPGSYIIKSRGIDAAGNTEVPGSSGPNVINVTLVFTPVNCPCHVYTAQAPVTPTENDLSALEVGMKFRSSIDGYIKGIRYYKTPGTQGVHTGQLFTLAGALLETSVFVNETSSGWQEILFTAPVAVTAGTTYIAAYHSASGDYSGINNFFTNPLVNYPLTGLADGTDGPNGLYLYTAVPAFPTQTYRKSGYWVDVVFATSNALPVELTDFTASRQENDVKLHWKTASEQNNKGFEVQRSIDGTHWTNIGFVNGYGNSQSVREYQYIDKNLQPGKYYYRLRQVDFDGNSKLSKVVVINLSGKLTLELKQNYPNPYNSATIIQYSVTTTDKVRLMVYDQVGRPVKQLVSEIKNPGTYQVTMYRNNLSAGIYYYKLETKDQVLIKKMTIF